MNSPRTITTHKSVFYVALKPNGKVYSESRNPDIVLQAAKLWRGPGELKFEEVIAVTHREPLQYQPMTERELKKLVENA